MEVQEVFEIGETVEYHPGAWMQHATGSGPIEIVTVVGFAHDGALLYENERTKGTIGVANIHQFIKKHKMKKAQIFTVVMVTCPYCDEDMEVERDPRSGEKMVCVHCTKEFIAVGADYSADDQ